MNKVKYFIFLYILISSGLYGADRSVKQVFAGAAGQGLDLPVFKAYLGWEETATTAIYFSFSGAFNYTFLRQVHWQYAIGFTVSSGDSVSVGGLDPYIFIYFPLVTMTRMTPFYFYNRITQKAGFTSRVGNPSLDRLAVFESGVSVSFINFFGQSYNYDSLMNYYYLSFILGPYLFVGVEQRYTTLYGYPIKRINSSFIVGQFYEFNFDVGKYTGDFYSSMRAVYFYFSTGVEFRFGVVK